MSFMIPGLDGLRAIASLSFSLLERTILNLNDRFFSIRKPRCEEKMLTITADL